MIVVEADPSPVLAAALEDAVGAELLGARLAMVDGRERSFVVHWRREDGSYGTHLAIVADGDVSLVSGHYGLSRARAEREFRERAR